MRTSSGKIVLQVETHRRIIRQVGGRRGILEEALDERAYRQHLRHTADVHRVSAITITVNAHAAEVASCSFEGQRRVLDVTMDEIGDRPLLAACCLTDIARVTEPRDYRPEILLRGHARPA